MNLSYQKIIRKMWCSLLSTIQVTLKDAMKHQISDPFITKAEELVHKWSKEVVKLWTQHVARAGTALLICWDDCWHWTKTASEPDMNACLTSDWTKLERLIKLFEPFPIHIVRFRVTTSRSYKKQYLGSAVRHTCWLVFVFSWFCPYAVVQIDRFQAFCCCWAGQCIHSF